MHRPCLWHLLIMVVPPARAAFVPWKKSSTAVIPLYGICRRVWTSIPPGITIFPLASMVLTPPGTMRLSPICLIRAHQDTHTEENQSQPLNSSARNCQDSSLPAGTPHSVLLPDPGLPEQNHSTLQQQQDCLPCLHLCCAQPRSGCHLFSCSASDLDGTCCLGQSLGWGSWGL